jgi:hypothetical protein
MPTGRVCVTNDLDTLATVTGAKADDLVSIPTS